MPMSTQCLSVHPPTHPSSISRSLYQSIHTCLSLSIYLNIYNPSNFCATLGKRTASCSILPLHICREFLLAFHLTVSQLILGCNRAFPRALFFRFLVLACVAHLPLAQSLSFSNTKVTLSISLLVFSR